jgi:hypothetical protein
VWIDYRTRSGGETITGRQQVVSSGVARWMMSLTFPLFNRETILAFRAWLAQMEGRANYTQIGPCDCSNGNRLIPTVGGIPYDDDSLHTDGAGFMQGGALPTISAAASAGATQITIINGSTQLPVLAGSYLGVGGYMYVVAAATALPDEKTLLEIRPKLRTSLAEDAVVDWCEARGPFRLVNDDSGVFDLQLSRIGAAVVDLVEVF